MTIYVILPYRASVLTSEAGPIIQGVNKRHLTLRLRRAFPQPLDGETGYYLDPAAEGISRLLPLWMSLPGTNESRSS